MTDPRFWGWLWQMEDEIRPLVPMVYYHVWDNFPPPTYNKSWYESTDVIACISKLTKDIVDEVVPDHKETYYLPHSINTDIFCKLPQEEVLKHRSEYFPDSENKTIFFFNSRNARRKQTGSLLFWFNTFLNKVGRDEAILLMHTDTKDPHGQDLDAIIEYLNLSGQVAISRDKLPPEQLALMYNFVDCTVSISDAEGFGLSNLESLACETPILVTMTGGLQEQVTDGENWFGIGLKPTSRAIIGSQDIPWIYEDRLSEEAVVNALEKIHNMDHEEREMLGYMGRQHVLKNYNMEKFGEDWDKIFSHVVENLGSWDTRKNYKSWDFSEVK
jgi:glycosyltransferase involved in cell wall biosynthesis